MPNYVSLAATESFWDVALTHWTQCSQTRYFPQTVSAPKNCQIFSTVWLFPFHESFLLYPSSTEIWWVFHQRIINSFSAPLRYKPSCQFYNPRVPLPRPWKVSLWNVIIRKHKAPISQFLWYSREPNFNKCQLANTDGLITLNNQPPNILKCFFANKSAQLSCLLFQGSLCQSLSLIAIVLSLS